ncbi:TPA: hypothetical protein SAN16_000553 [Campylobacter jejuni]|nr:hypothetical protein [Campylobacter jejuni]
MSDKDDLIIPEEIRQAWDEIEPILDYGNTILETFNSCGLICKKNSYYWRCYQFYFSLG